MYLPERNRKKRQGRKRRCTHQKRGEKTRKQERVGNIDTERRRKEKIIRQKETEKRRKREDVFTRRKRGKRQGKGEWEA